MKWKLVIGVILMAASVAALYLWENTFRDELTLDKVLAASKDIRVGEVVSYDDFKVLSITPSSKLNESLSMDDVSKLLGKLAVTEIKENQQILESYFIDFDDVSKEGFYNFVIPGEWLSPSTMLIEERNKISLYSLPDKYYLGTYKVMCLHEDGSIEINASLENYYYIYDEVKLGNSLISVIEEM